MVNFTPSRLLIALLLSLACSYPVSAQGAPWIEIATYLDTGQTPQALRLIAATDASALPAAEQNELALGGAYFALILEDYDSAAGHLERAGRVSPQLSGSLALSSRYLRLTLEQALAHRRDPGKSRLSLISSWNEAKSALQDYRPGPGESVALYPRVLGGSFALWLDQMIEAELFLGDAQPALIQEVQNFGRSTAEAWASPAAELPTVAVYLAYLEAVGETVGGLPPLDPLAQKLTLDSDFQKVRQLIEAANAAAYVDGVSNSELADGFLGRVVATQQMRELERLNEQAAGRKFDDQESSRMREILISLKALIAGDVHIGNLMRYYVVGTETALHSQRTGWEDGVKALLESFPESLAQYPALHARALVVRSTLRRLDGQGRESQADAKKALLLYRQVAGNGMLGPGGLLRLRRQAKPAFEAMIAASIACQDVESAYGAAWTFLALESQLDLPFGRRDVFLNQSSAQLAAKLSADQRYLLYFPGESGLFIFTVDSRGLSWTSVDIGSTALREGLQRMGRALRVQQGCQRLEGTAWEGKSVAARLLDTMPPGDFTELVIGAPGYLVNCPWSYLITSSARLSTKPPTLRMSDLSGQPSAWSGTPGLRALGDPDGTLPGAALEVRRLAELVPAARTAVGKEADRSFLREFQKGILHLATHGVIDYRLSSASYLVLAGPDHLLASEVGELDLPRANSDLVVLSACESGSHVLDETGLRSLSGAFLRAGASRVLGTLWRVDDNATYQLMERFYQELSAGKTPEQALLMGQTQLRTSPTHSDPYFWASFTLYSH